MKLESRDHFARPEGQAATPDANRVHVAIINADLRATSALEHDLRRRGFEVTCYAKPENAQASLRSAPVDVALIDMRAEDTKGYATLHRLREQGDMPVVLLTDSDDEVEEILALRMGADVVLRRPWSPQLLAERLRALTRRARGTVGPVDSGRNRLSCPPLEIDTDRMTAFWRGTQIHLTATEFRLLHALAERPGYVRTRDFLMDRLYGNDIFVLDRTVDSHVKRLRRKLRDADPEFDAIETLYGTGYRLTLPQA
ncbi:response regulator transcription factor [Roseicyclus marinus]|uniref:response regulator transcription factor n=1 Tax=Roseicyclus marinus TaxID=2161673 RepID=UPI00240EA781|nr:response regulator transcription factor [Roseicyclus marinus]MDG3040390.1 response regulator transcription factor [Roseicyclus marinus]